MNEKEARLRAEAYCSAAERCRSEVLAKLSAYVQKDGLEPDSLDSIMTQLESDGFIDEYRYAVAFVHDKFSLSKWGRVKIRYALLQKGIPEQTAARALDAMDSDEYCRVMTGVLERKARETGGAADFGMAARLLRYAVQRGIEPSLAREIISHIQSDREQ